MRETKIEWTHHTYNPWWGCVKVSPGCAHCYAEAFDRRTHGTERHTDARGVVREPHWGKDAPRRFFGDAHWRQPIAWNRAAEKAGERRRVFCASMADVFEDRPDLVTPRRRLFDLIDATPSLDWLLLTKRPENIGRLATAWCVENGALHNVWLGTTVENQEQADLRIPHLLRVPAAVRFLSVEPLLGPVDLSKWLWKCARRGECADPDIPWHDNDCPAAAEPSITWVIVGGESGPGARPCDVAWIRDVVRQCREAGTACFVKQLGARPIDARHTDIVCGGQVHYVRPSADTMCHEASRTPGYSVRPHEMGRLLQDPKGGDPAEWPEDLRVREFPEVSR